LVRSTTNQQWIKPICVRRIGTFQSIVHQAHLVGGRPIRSYLVLGQKLSLFSIALASLFRSSLVARAPCRVGHFALSELNIVVIYDLDRLPHVSRKSGKPPSNVMASASLKSAACHLFIIDDQTKIIDDQTKMATVRRLPASFSAER